MLTGPCAPARGVFFLVGPKFLFMAVARIGGHAARYRGEPFADEPAVTASLAGKAALSFMLVRSVSPD